ncbi:hypothetical protein [Helicobacter suis]|uniref:hypothetical protein n=1 Tax=Helicobacter suis TaxID=104628 RepID=UPI0013D4314F|nr:hypothetical protein [Helicobacter suis]
MLTSTKQINGYFVVVESISTKHNELKLKTLYRENGKLENNPLFSGVNMRTTQVAETSLSPKPSVSHALTHTKEDITTPALKNQPTKTTPQQSLAGLKNRRSKGRLKQMDNPQSLDDAGFTSKSVSEQPIKENLEELDKRIIQPEEFTPELIKQLRKNPKQRVMIGEASEYFKSIFADDTRNFNPTFHLNGETINYILKNHGAKATAIKQGKELPITINDIINYPKMLDEVDYIMGVPRYNYREPAYEIDYKKKRYLSYSVLAGKQFKDHYLIIECTSSIDMTLTNMYKVKGNIKDSIDFKPPEDSRDNFFKLKNGLDAEGRPVNSTQLLEETLKSFTMIQKAQLLN